MSKVILSNGNEIQISSIRTCGQKSICFVIPETNVDATQFVDVDAFVYVDDDGKKERYTDLVFVQVFCDVAEPSDIESDIESTETTTAESTVIFREMQDIEKRLATLERTQSEQDEAILDLASTL